MPADPRRTCDRRFGADRTATGGGQLGTGTGCLPAPGDGSCLIAWAAARATYTGPVTEAGYMALDLAFDASTLSRLRKAVFDEAAGAGMPNHRAADVVIAVHELARLTGPGCPWSW